jgi:Mce-associated membrane protein
VSATSDRQLIIGLEFTMTVDADALDDISPGEANIDCDDVVTRAAQPDAGRESRGKESAWRRIMAYAILPGLVLSVAIGASYLKWQDGVLRETGSAAAQSVAAASDSTVAILSYRADTVEKDLTVARDRLTGGFRDAYTQLVHDVVIPGAKQKHISAAATVPAAASVKASANHAVVLVFVDQTTTIGDDAPTNTTSSIRISLDKVHDRWLISQFDPV